MGERGSREGTGTFLDNKWKCHNFINIVCYPLAELCTTDLKEIMFVYCIDQSLK